MRGEENSRLEDERRKRVFAETMARKERLRSLNVKMNSPQNVNDMENIPAYMRRGYALDNVPHSSEPMMSRWSITDESEPHISSDSAYLHDNVD